MGAGRPIISNINLSPLEISILYLLYFEKRNMDDDEIGKAVGPLFGEVKTADLMQALVNVLEKEKRYVESRYVVTDDSRSLSMRYSLTAKAFSTHFAWKTRGRPAGSDVQIDTMTMIAFQQMRQGRYCLPDFEGTGNGLRGMLIVEPDTVEHGGKRVYSQSWWNDDTALAVAVETDPAKRLDDIYADWNKSHDNGCGMWFITFSEKHRDMIRDSLDSSGVPPVSYAATVFPKRLLTEHNDIMVELPYISPRANRTDGDLERRRIADALPMNETEFAVWEALDAAESRSITEVKEGLAAVWRPDGATMREAFTTLARKGMIRISCGKAVRDVDASRIYEGMVRDGKPVVKT